MAKLLDKLKKFFSGPDYIEWDETNSMWNGGYLHVHVNGEIVESIFVDDRSEDNPYDIIDELKEKYSITRVKETNRYDWR